MRRELSHMTDRELADIGITRSDIERIASGEAHTFAECGRLMGIGKPAKILNEHQLQALLLWLETRKHALLSFKAGLRTKVIA